jgi:NADH-quinone oxidoreductase subunit M
LLPIALSPLVYFIDRKKRAAGALCFIALAASGLLLSVEIPTILGGKKAIETYPWIGLLNLEFGLLVDGIALLIGLSVVLLAALSALASIAYLKGRHEHGAYYCLLLLFTSAMLGLVLATNLLQFYLFWELMTIPSFFLIVGWGYRDPQRIGLKYFLWTRASGLCLLLGILWLHSLTGSFALNQGAVAGGQNWAPIFSLFMVAFFIKMAILPFHNWLPDAHAEAPAPISALLSGVMIKMGAYGVVRIGLGMGPTPYLVWFLGLGAFTMLYGAMMALLQRDVKRLLAFSSVSQMGLILFGLLTIDMGVAGGLFHLINHAIAKGLLFLGSGALLYRVGTRDMVRMGGLVKRMPITAITMAIAAVSLSATPPLSAFVSEVLIVGGGIYGGHYWLTTIILVSSILTAGYFLWMLYQIFFGKLPLKLGRVREAPAHFTIPLILLAIPIVLFGIWPDLILGVIA